MRGGGQMGRGGEGRRRAGWRELRPGLRQDLKPGGKEVLIPRVPIWAFTVSRI